MEKIADKIIEDEEKMNNLGEEIAEKLCVKAKQLAKEIAGKIFKKAKECSEDPLVWPLSIEEEIKSVRDRERIISAVISELENNGFVYINGIGFDAIDIFTEELFEVAEEEKEFISAKKAKSVSDDAIFNKMCECSMFISDNIEEKAGGGDKKIIINTTTDPFNSNPNLIKKMIKKLVTNGFLVVYNDKEIDILSRPDYAEMKKILVSW